MSEEKQITTTDQNNELASFIPEDGQLSLDDLLQDAEGVQLQFDKIKIPGGGSIFWQMTDLETGEEDSKKTLRGVILKAQPYNCRYESAFDGSNNPPDCASVGGAIGIDNEGNQHECATCEYNQFGSGENGGKACQNRRNLYILLEGESVPRIISLPASAASNFATLQTQLVLTKRLLRQVIVKISLEKKSNKGGIEYSCPVFSIDGNVRRDYDEAKLEALNDAIKLLKCAGIM